MKVRSLANNQYVITDGKVAYFQSYGAMIAKITRGFEVVMIREAFDISATTSKYLIKFINEESIYEVNNKQAKKYVDNGTFKTVDIIG